MKIRIAELVKYVPIIREFIEEGERRLYREFEAAQDVISTSSIDSVVGERGAASLIIPPLMLKRKAIHARIFGKHEYTQLSLYIAQCGKEE